MRSTTSSRAWDCLGCPAALRALINTSTKAATKDGDAFDMSAPCRRCSRTRRLPVPETISQGKQAQYLVGLNPGPSGKVHAHSFGQLCFLDDAFDLAGNFAQILILGRNVDVDNAKQLVMVHLGWRRNSADLDHRIQIRRLGALSPAQRNLLQIHHCLHLVLGILHGEHVRIAALGIDPIIGGNHPVGGQRGDDVVHDFLLREAQQAGFLAVDV